MCLIVFAWKHHPRFPLVVAANRDEFTDRPTEAASFWLQTPELLAGRDLVGGGTWLGISRSGRFSAVTNYRDLSQRLRGAPSRVKLVSDFLVGSVSPGEYLSGLSAHGDDYAGFNLLVADRRSLLYYSNLERRMRPLAPGVYGLSNGFLDTPWPKVVRSREALTAALKAPDGPDPEALFAILCDTTRPHDRDLPHTGVGLEWERLLSSPFIAAPEYGTRSSTALLVDAAGMADFRERTFTQMGSSSYAERSFRFALND